MVLFIVLPANLPISAGHWPPWIGTLLQLSLLATVIYTQVYRYRDVSDARERQQTRWVVYGVTLAMCLSSAAELSRFLWPLPSQPGPANLLYESIFLAVWDLSLAIIPVTIGIAILRQRLYDIDIISNRTLVYGLLTAILAGLFAGIISLSQKLFVALTGQTSDIATVLATLCIVAASTPVKNRLQGAVDKRFKDASDPALRLKAFGEQVRSRLAPVNPRQVACRLLDETVAAFDAQGGVVNLEQQGQLQLIHRSGEWDGVAALEAPLETDGRRLGTLSLAGRRDRCAYRPKDREALEHLAWVVAAAIQQDAEPSA